MYIERLILFYKLLFSINKYFEYLFLYIYIYLYHIIFY